MYTHAHILLYVYICKCKCYKFGLVHLSLLTDTEPNFAPGACLAHNSGNT